MLGLGFSTDMERRQRRSLLFLIMRLLLLLIQKISRQRSINPSGGERYPSFCSIDADRAGELGQRAQRAPDAVLFTEVCILQKIPLYIVLARGHNWFTCQGNHAPRLTKSQAASSSIQQNGGQQSLVFHTAPRDLDAACPKPFCSKKYFSWTNLTPLREDIF